MKTISQQATSEQSPTLQSSQPASGTRESQSPIQSPIQSPTQSPTQSPNAADQFNSSKQSLAERITSEANQKPPQLHQQTTSNGPVLVSPTQSNAQHSTRQEIQNPAQQAIDEATRTPVQQSATPVQQPVQPQDPHTVNPTTFREALPTHTPVSPPEVTPPREFSPVRQPSPVSDIRSPEPTREPTTTEAKPWYKKVGEFFVKAFSFLVGIVKGVLSLLGPIFSFVTKFVKPRGASTPSERPSSTHLPTTPARSETNSSISIPRSTLRAAPPTLRRSPLVETTPTRTPADS